VQVIDNTGHHDESHAIIPQMVKQGAEVFIAGNIGPYAFQLVRSLDCQVALARKMLVREALEKWRAGKLEILSAPTVKRSFHDHTHH
jgi:predicted Fe-Mo cluster-binding NifX family protein